MIKIVDQILLDQILVDRLLLDQIPVDKILIDRILVDQIVFRNCSKFKIGCSEVFYYLEQILKETSFVYMIDFYF